MLKKFQMFLCTNTSRYTEPGNTTLLGYNPEELLGSSNTYAVVQEVEIELDVPEFDVVDLKVRVMEAQLQQDLAESHVRQQTMRDQIAELKCIGVDS